MSLHEEVAKLRRLLAESERLLAEASLSFAAAADLVGEMEKAIAAGGPVPEPPAPPWFGQHKPAEPASTSQAREQCECGCRAWVKKRSLQGAEGCAACGRPRA